MKETIRVLLSEEEVDRRIKEVADQINRDYAGKEVHLICVLKGGVFFMCELAKRITVPVSLDFMSVSSYGDDTKSSGVVRIVKDLDQPLSVREKIVSFWRIFCVYTQDLGRLYLFRLRSSQGYNFVSKLL